MMFLYFYFFFFFFFNDTATTEIYTLSLHDALPISAAQARCDRWWSPRTDCAAAAAGAPRTARAPAPQRRQPRPPARPAAGPTPGLLVCGPLHEPPDHCGACHCASRTAAHLPRRLRVIHSFTGHVSARNG